MRREYSRARLRLEGIAARSKRVRDAALDGSSRYRAVHQGIMRGCAASPTSSIP